MLFLNKEPNKKPINKKYLFDNSGINKHKNFLLPYILKNINYKFIIKFY